MGDMRFSVECSDTRAFSPEGYYYAVMLGTLSLTPEEALETAQKLVAAARESMVRSAAYERDREVREAARLYIANKKTAGDAA